MTQSTIDGQGGLVNDSGGSQPKDSKSLTDNEALGLIKQLRQWAFEKYGEEMINPHGPQVGGEVHSMPMEQSFPGDGEETYAYSETDHAKDYLINPHLYKPKWLAEVTDLLTTDPDTKSGQAEAQS